MDINAPAINPVGGKHDLSIEARLKEKSMYGAGIS
jgi:hypothetical protein